MDGETKTEKGWFSSFGRKNKTNAPTTATGANGYGYGNSAYTGNY
jgi:hypothetical protein